MRWFKERFGEASSYAAIAAGAVAAALLAEVAGASGMAISVLLGVAVVAAVVGFLRRG